MLNAMSVSDEALYGFVSGVPDAPDQKGFQDMTANSFSGPSIDRRVVRPFTIPKR
jgi:hypothetical protein